MRWTTAAAGMLAALMLTACTAPSPSLQEKPVTLASGLDAPWSVALVGDSALISQRDDGKVLERTASGELRTAGTVPGVVSGGEAGLNGIVVRELDGIRWLYAYHATDDDNRVVRMPLRGEPGGLRLDTSAVEDLVTGIPHATNHNGGRLAFGPDGMLYITTGDAGQRERARDRTYLGGKILRVTPTGDPAPGNPFGTRVYSLGHRNVQGIAWDDDDTLWASEFGQDTWDEVNRIVAGGDYGWPDHEGIAKAADAIDPAAVWKPADASPSGIAVIDGTLYIAGLRGQRVWLFDPSHPDEEPWVAAFTEDYGRVRDVLAGTDGRLWLLTSNTDGRGDSREGDDRLVQPAFREG
nr:PQQ-dependent sugar dehydrogenase [uncultured Microbacterium sp.]